MGRTGRPRSVATAAAGDRLAGPAAGLGAGQDNTHGIHAPGGFPAGAGSSPKPPPERSPDPRPRQSARRERRGGTGLYGGTHGRRSAPRCRDTPAGARPGSCEHNRNGRGEVSDGQKGNAGGHLCWKGKIFAAGRPIVQPNGSLPQLSHSHQQTCAHTKHQATETILWALEPVEIGKGHHHGSGIIGSGWSLVVAGRRGRPGPGRFADHHSGTPRSLYSRAPESLAEPAPAKPGPVWSGHEQRGALQSFLIEGAASCPKAAAPWGGGQEIPQEFHAVVCLIER